ncbi:ALG3-domain-containing protein, partial [Rozella allomycis CSF55]
MSIPFIRNTSKLDAALKLMLILSKRTHSIYVLRMFNDPIAMIFFWQSVQALLENNLIVSALSLSLALGVKMNILLSFPGIFVALYVTKGFRKTFFYFTIVGAFQLLVAIPFLATFPLEYSSNAFNFKRKFLYEWTVNWKFLPENVFLSPSFSIPFPCVNSKKKGVHPWKLMRLSAVGLSKKDTLDLILNTALS